MAPVSKALESGSQVCYPRGARKKRTEALRGTQLWKGYPGRPCAKGARRALGRQLPTKGSFLFLKKHIWTREPCLPKSTTTKRLTKSPERILFPNHIPPRRRSGFTLIELVASAILVSLMMSALLSVLWSSLRQSQELQRAASDGFPHGQHGESDSRRFPERTGDGRGRDGHHAAWFFWGPIRQRECRH